MSDIYICKYFDIRELVPIHVWEERGEKAWQLLDRGELITIDTLREDKGKIKINDWLWNTNPKTQRQWSGLRTSASPYGSIYSQHRFGRATDKIMLECSANEARAHILDNPDRFPYVKGVELGISWVHTDSRNCNGIMKFYP